MQVKERSEGDVTILDLQGRLVLEDGDAALREKVNELVAQGRVKILINLRDVTYIDSCGVGVLIAKFVSVRRRGGDVRLANLTPRSQHLMDITRLRDIFQIYDSEAAAVASFAAPIRH